jgi:phosphatidate phosphatase
LNRDFARYKPKMSKMAVDVQSIELSVVKFILDCVVFIAIGLGIVYIQYTIPHQRGFFCDDQSIRYPYKPDTVTTPMLFAIGYGIPLIFMVLCECSRMYWEVKYLNRVISHFRMGRFVVHRLVVRLWRFLGYFMLGSCCVFFLTNIGKFSIGRLRPHFLSVCKPDWSLLNCSSGTLDSNYYVTAAECTAVGPELTVNVHRLKEARLSFPSGHSSFSFYSMTFLTLYVQARIHRHSFFCFTFRPMLQLMFMSLAAFTALSRVSDYKHHWSDVLAGSALGMVIAFIVACHCAKVFMKKPPEETKANEALGIQRNPSSDLLVPNQEMSLKEPNDPSMLV